MFLFKPPNFKFKYFYGLATLKIKQLATTIEIHVICLSPLNEPPAKSLNVDSTKEVVEVLD